MGIKKELLEKIQNKTLVMGVCGLGYVGLPLAVDKAKHGFKTIGFDVQQGSCSAWMHLIEGRKTGWIHGNNRCWKGNNTGMGKRHMDGERPRLRI